MLGLLGSERFGFLWNELIDIYSIVAVGCIRHAHRSGAVNCALLVFSEPADVCGVKSGVGEH